MTFSRKEVLGVGAAAYVSGAALGLAVGTYGRGSLSGALIWTVLSAANLAIGVRILKGRYRSYRKELRLGEGQTVVFTSPFRYLICGLLGWHGRLRDSVAAGANTEATCGKCGFRGLVDSQGGLF